MDITPHVNLLRSLRGERIDYILLIGEGVDNAFDAGATSITIMLDPDEISFQDNGIGITKDRIQSIFSLGEHGPMSTTQLGRFGIGIKSQAVNAGNILQVVSVSVDGRVRVQVDWRKILRTGEWSIDDPRWLPVAIDAPTGTTLIISGLRKPPAIANDKILSDIAQRFYPAIAAGRRVTINGAPVNLLSEPTMQDVIEREFGLSEGRSARLRAGILAQPSKLNRVHVAYKHRVIMPASTLGCGEYGGLTKMFARLQLNGPWHLAKFKNDLTDELEREELEEAVKEALRPILEKCNSASMSARVDEVANLINDMIPPNLRAARPERQKDTKKNPGGKKHNESGFVDKDKSDEKGPAKTKRPPQNHLLITFDGLAETDGIGAFQPGRPHRVNLSKDDPHIAQLLEHRDLAVGVRSLYALAIAIFEQARDEITEPELPFEPFGKRIAKLLAMQDAIQRVGDA